MICGRMPYTMACRRVAPVAVIASSGPASMFSMASENNLPMRPKVVTVSASIPAKGPKLTQ